MRNFIIVGMLAVLSVTIGTAQTPAIRTDATGVVSNATYAARGLPNSGIAQGSIFAIFGTNLGPAALTQQPSYPLNTTLGGTSVKVTVGGVSKDAIPAYVLATQIGAILPSDTPVGEGTVTVTFNGQTSASHAITVVPNNFGTFTLNQQGSGPAAVMDAATFQAFSLTSPGKPGQIITIWGTGLGAISGDDKQTPPVGSLPGVPVEVFIGGKPAKIVYSGRAPCCSGIDQVNVIVPDGLSGCYNSILVKINNSVGNVSTMPVSTGGACSDTFGISSGDISTLLGKGTFSIGSVTLGRATSPSSNPLVPGTIKTEIAGGGFTKYTPQQFTASQGAFQQVSIGSCSIFSFLGTASADTDPVQPVVLNAGPALSVSGPNGTKPIPRDANSGEYSATVGGGATNPLPLFIPDAGGTFTFTGPGGPDVDAFSTSLAVPPPLTWSNADQITDIQRSQGVTINWTGGDPASYVIITGTSVAVDLTNSSLSAIVEFTCTAPVGPKTFTVPAAVLLAMPPSTIISAGGFSIGTGSLIVFNFTQPKTFTVPKVDIAFATAYFATSKTVNYK
ncbi:MAG: hypothetical protein LAP87_04575 [Acidobacteriia bacterium]|nr:hypothetical protein [Terriglobia bacterium]